MFDTKIGNFFKNYSYSKTILKKLLLTLFIIYLFMCFYNSNNLINFFLITFIVLFTNMIFVYIFRKKVSGFLKNNDIDILNSIICSVIITIFIPINYPLLFLILDLVIANIIVKVAKLSLNLNINYTVLTIFIVALTSNFIGNSSVVLFSDFTNIFIVLGYIVILSYLSVNYCVNVKITLIYLVVLILGLVILGELFDLMLVKNYSLIFDFYNIFFSIYIINDYKSIPYLSISQYIYGAFIGFFMLLSLLFKNNFIVLLGIIMLNICSNIIDNFVLNKKMGI